MPVSDTHDKNGMIPKEQLSHVLDLLAISINSLSGCYHNINYYARLLKMAKEELLKNMRKTDEMIDVYSPLNGMIGTYELIFFKNVKDLYEFFYQTSNFEKIGYYACQFPIDWKKFKKERVPENEMKRLMKNRKKNAKRIIELVHQNREVFLSSLTVKVRCPKFEDPELD